MIKFPQTHTSIQVFKEGTDLLDLIKRQQPSPLWGDFARGLVEDGRFVWPRKGKHDDQAHPPIHPTQCITDLDGNHKKVYDYVVRYFLACCAPVSRAAQTPVGLVRLCARASVCCYMRRHHAHACVIIVLTHHVCSCMHLLDRC